MPKDIVYRNDCYENSFDKKGNLWITIYNSGVFGIDTATGSYLSYYYRNGYSLEVPGQISCGEENMLWITNQSAVVGYNTRTKKINTISYQQYRNNGLPREALIRPFCDRAGNLWVASFAGLIKIEVNAPRLHSTYYKGVKVGNQYVPFRSNTQVQINDSILLMGVDAGLYIMNLKSGENEKLNLLTKQVCDKPVYSIKEIAGTNKFIVSSIYHYLLQIEIIFKGQKYIGKIDTIRISDNKYTVAGFEMVDNTTIAVNTIYNGIYIVNLNDHKFLQLLPKNPLSGKAYSISSLATAPNYLWIITSDNWLVGYDLISKKYAFKNLKTGKYAKTEFSCNDIYSNTKAFAYLGVSPFGIWRVGTDNNFREWCGSNAMLSTGIGNFVLENDSVMWVMTDKGLVTLKLQSGESELYNSSSGLVASSGLGWLSKGKLGELVLGDYNSFHLIKGNYENRNAAKPIIYFSEIKLLNDTEDFTYNKACILEYRQNSIEFNFGTIDYSNPEKIIYEYRLIGASSLWTSNGSNRNIIFANLNPGEYTFEVRAVNGTNSSEIIPYQFIIKPPFWNTWWFYLILIIFIAIIIYNIFKYRLRQIKNVFEIREKIARDLHDEIGSTLSSVSILSKVAIGSKVDQSQSILKNINDQSQQAAQSITDIVWSLKKDNENIQQLVSRMKHFASSLFEAKNINFDFKLQTITNNKKIKSEIVYNTYLIFKEAVNNASKYSKAGLVNIEIEITESNFSFSIHDNGIGFDQSKTNGNGLGNMKKRATQLNGNLLIDSSLERGTNIKFSVSI